MCNVVHVHKIYNHSIYIHTKYVHNKIHFDLKKLFKRLDENCSTATNVILEKRKKDKRMHLQKKHLKLLALHRLRIQHLYTQYVFGHSCNSSILPLSTDEYIFIFFLHVELQYYIMWICVLIRKLIALQSIWASFLFIRVLFLTFLW